MSTRRRLHRLATKTRVRVAAVAGPIAGFWALELLDTVILGGRLDQFGVQPRSVAGLWGIPLSPALHGGFGHLVANTVPWLVLGFLTTARSAHDYWRVVVVSAATGGLGAWILGAPGTVHIGASGVVFGFLGFLMGRGYWERRWSAIALSLAVTLGFGSMLWGMVPVLAGVSTSWQAHLFGWLGGLWMARASAARGRDK
ncbi:MAG: rhomboid family intramembrane serine protease [Deltaproteobacteria bacterium]|nr:rhomboid family intramembrane serine protease [Deltaproteobacteria bacterium]